MSIHRWSIHRQAWIAGVAAIVGASGCGGEAPLPGGADERVGEAESAIAATCPGTQLIGRVQPGDDCPVPPADAGSLWAYQHLFDGLGQPLPAVLQPFCVYTWTGNGPPDHSALPSYQGNPPSSWLDPDCMSVAAMSDTGDAIAAITPELDRAFLTQIEAPVTIPPAPNGGSVRVAVVDAWPGVGKVGNFEHGFGMAAIARRVACGPGPSSCFMIPSPHLALDLLEPDVRNRIHGGFFGYQGRLARAIAEAVYAWEGNAQEEKLVINLSVGWDGRYNTGPDGLISEPVLAVRAALEHAACKGALVIAAAGNAGSGPSPGAGPVFPAAWEQIPAPTCGSSPPRPLVYAAAGVNGRDLPLANARPGARPELAAPAFVVPGVMDNGAGPVISGPFTGSSVAAAVTSGIAASVWHQDPSLRPDQVMNLIRASAVSSGETADFCLTSPCGVVRRVSLCRALETVTGVHPLPCTKIPFGTGLDPTWSPADLAAIEATATKTYDGTDLLTLDHPPICSSEVYIPSGLTSFPGPFPCPSETLPNAIVAPTVGPQPLENPCPACTFYPSFNEFTSSFLVLGINERTPTVYAHIMKLSSRAGGVVARYDLASATNGEPLLGGQVYRIELPAVPTSFSSATIEWVNTPDAQTTSNLTIGY